MTHGAQHAAPLPVYTPEEILKGRKPKKKKKKGKQGSSVHSKDKSKTLRRSKRKEAACPDYCHALFVRNLQKLTAPLVVV